MPAKTKTATKAASTKPLMKAEIVEDEMMNKPIVTLGEDEAVTQSTTDTTETVAADTTDTTSVETPSTSTPVPTAEVVKPDEEVVATEAEPKESEPVKTEEKVEEEKVEEESIQASSMETPKIETNVPKVDLNAPLPKMEAPVVDEVMENAQKEWGAGIMMFVVFAIIVLLGAWGFYVSISSMNMDKEVMDQKVAQASVAPSAMPSPSAATATMPQLTVDVLNGSGVPKAASKIAAKFEELDQKIGEVGNTDDQDGNSVMISKDLEMYEKDIVMLLEKASVSDAKVKVSSKLSENSIEVIIGK